MGTRALHDRAERLRADGIPFVHARVVLAERPTSAKPGDEAIAVSYTHLTLPTSDLV